MCVKDVVTERQHRDSARQKLVTLPPKQILMTSLLRGETGRCPWGGGGGVAGLESRSTPTGKCRALSRTGDTHDR